MAARQLKRVTAKPSKKPKSKRKPPQQSAKKAAVAKRAAKSKRPAQAKAKGKPPSVPRAPAKRSVPRPAARRQNDSKQAAPKKAVRRGTAPRQAARKQATPKQAARKQVASKQVAPKQAQVPSLPAAKAARAPRPTPARDAVTALAQKRTIASMLSPVDGTAVVDAYLRDVDHPFKAEMQAVRQIIMGVSPKISERIKWNAPSFYYKEDLAAFNPRATELAQLILLFPDGAGMQDDEGLLEGKQKDRREVTFRSLAEVAAKRPALERVVERWLARRDA